MPLSNTTSQMSFSLSQRAPCQRSCATILLGLGFLSCNILCTTPKPLSSSDTRATDISAIQASEVPFIKIGELKKGGYGYVDRVISTISRKEYARKLIPRGRTFKKDKQVMLAYIKEVSNLKRLSHRHLVDLVGIHTDKKFLAIVMLPVADCNLQTFLEQPDPSNRTQSFLRPFFGLSHLSTMLFAR